MSKSTENQILWTLSSILLMLLFSCSQKQELKFPLKVGTNPESITMGFNGNYYVTLMNGNEIGDGEVVEISKYDVKVFAKGFDEPKGIVYLNDHLYFSDLTRIWKVEDRRRKRGVYICSIHHFRGCR